MANNENLEKGKATQFRSGEEAARNGSKGGIASGAARRRKKSLKEAADLYLSLPVTDKRRLNKLKRRALDPEDIDNQMAMIVGLTRRRPFGDARAARSSWRCWGRRGRAHRPAKGEGAIGGDRQCYRLNSGEYLTHCNHRWNLKIGATGSGKSWLDYAVVILSGSAPSVDRGRR